MRPALLPVHLCPQEPPSIRATLHTPLKESEVEVEVEAKVEVESEVEVGVAIGAW